MFDEFEKELEEEHDRLYNNPDKSKSKYPL